MTTADVASEQSEKKVSLPTLTAMVVGSMIGAGVFAYAKANFGNYVGRACDRGDRPVTTKGTGP